MADQFLTKSKIDLSQCIEFGGGLALESYPALHATLNAKCGPEVARIFAEPLLSRGNDTAAPSISWYTDVEGTGQPISRLDEAGQAAITAELSQHLRAVRGVLDDPDDGGLIAAALHIADAGDVWSVGGRPVILNWGMLPADLDRDGPTRRAHYERTLGRFLPLGAAPPLTPAERQNWQDQRAGAASEPTSQSTPPAAVAAAAAGGATAGAAGMAAANTPPPGETPPPRPPTEPRRMPVAAWLPLLLLLLLAGGTLAWLLMPGSRIFPQVTQDQAITDEATLAAAQGINRSLEERLASLQNSLDNAMCTDDGTLLMPDGHTIEGLLPPNPNDPQDLPGSIRQAAPTSILPPNPERVRVPNPGSSAPNDTASLVAHIEERTAIVLVPTGNGLGSGTGFFVGPDLIVTNHHVIANAGPQGVFITNQALGKLHKVEILKTLGPFQTTSGDFALLRVPGVSQPAYTILQSQQSLKLQSVIAAGYPGDLLQTDDQFQQLRSGNIQAVPDVALTDGTISTMQNVNNARMIAHSAPINKGNSGGPLVDMCGRVAGVNTFIKRGTARTLNFALSTGDLMRFLNGTAALPTIETELCDPQIERPSPPVSANLGTGEEATPPITPLPPLTVNE